MEMKQDNLDATVAGESHGQACRLLQDAERDLRIKSSALESCLTGVAFADLDGRLTYVNGAFVELWGLNSKQEVLGRSAMDVWRMDRKVTAVVNQLIDTSGWSGELVIKRPDGCCVHVQQDISLVTNEAGEPVCMMACFTDITERKQAQQQLEKTNEEHSQLLAAITSIFIGVDERDHVTQWNSAAEQTFGTRACEVIGRPFWQCPLRWDWNAIMEGVDKCREQGRPFRMPDIRFERPDGKEGILGVTLSPFKKDTSRVPGFILMGSDITERRIMEAQLNQAQKLESIGRLASGIAHEINTPTQYVADNTHFLQNAFADILELLDKYDQLLQAARQGDLPDTLLDDVEQTAKAADLDYLVREIPHAIKQSLEGLQRVSKIVRAMKEFSHPNEQAKTEVNINKAIQSTICVARNEWKYVAEMVLDLAPDLPPVPCLPGEFNQAVLNIIINAAHAVADVVGDGSDGKGTITVSTRSDGNWVEIRISDTGTGIPDNLADKIFDPFFTTKQVGKGTGQGLAIARSAIVDKHGGTIHFETEVGKGTTFIIRLPLHPAADERSGEVC